MGLVIDWHARQFSQCDTKIPAAALHISSSGWNRGSLQTRSLCNYDIVQAQVIICGSISIDNNLSLWSKSGVLKQYCGTSSCLASEMSQDPIERNIPQFVHVVQELMWTERCWSLSHLWWGTAPRKSHRPITGPILSDKQAPTLSHLHLLTIWCCQSTKDTCPSDCGRKPENTERRWRPDKNELRLESSMQKKKEETFLID